MTNSWSIPQGAVHVNMIAIRFRTFWFFSAEQLLPTGTQYLLFWADWLVLQHISLFKFHWAQATELLNFLAVVDNVLPNILKKHIPWEAQPRRLAVMPSIILAVDSFNRNSFLATCAYGKDMPCFLHLFGTVTTNGMATKVTHLSIAHRTSTATWIEIS